MMLPEFDYTAPTTTQQAITDLARPGARSLAGGQGVLTAMKLRRLAPSQLVDLRGLAELRGVELFTGGALHIGALTTLSELLEVPGLADRQPALVQAAGAVADTQIRNRGTVGGTLVDRFSASDLAAVLLILQATVSVTGPDGPRTVPMTGFYSPDGPLLGPADIVVAVDVPAPDPAVRTAYERITDRATLSPLVAVAAGVGPGSVRIAVTGATRWPRRLPEAEAALSGDASATEVPVGPDGRFLESDTVSAAYRAHLTRVLIRRAVDRAAADA